MYTNDCIPLLKNPYARTKIDNTCEFVSADGEPMASANGFFLARAQTFEIATG